MWKSAAEIVALVLEKEMKDVIFANEYDNTFIKVDESGTITIEDDVDKDDCFFVTQDVELDMHKVYPFIKQFTVENNSEILNTIRYEDTSLHEVFSTTKDKVTSFIEISDGYTSREFYIGQEDK